MSADTPRMLADIGGTNVRFATQAPGQRPAALSVLAADAFATLADAANSYLAGVDPADRPRMAAFAVASPVIGDRIDMTNRAWSFSIEALRQALGLDRLLVVNDIEAVALALKSVAWGATPRCRSTRPATMRSPAMRPATRVAWLLVPLAG